MKIAIFSDVHGNLTALETVLADIQQQAPDLIAFAGDLCFGGPRPAGCLTRVREVASVAVYGNTDEFLFDPQPIADEWPEEKKARLRPFKELEAWTRDKLASADLAWLARLPFACRFSPTTDPQDDLLIVHANPQEVNTPIFPTAAVQTAAEVARVIAQEEEEIRPLLSNITAHTIAYGHIHLPNVRTVNGIALANISSVSRPLGKDKRAKYGLLTWTRAAGWQIEQRHVPYNRDKEKDLISFLKPPGWQGMAQEI